MPSVVMTMMAEPAAETFEAAGRDHGSGIATACRVAASLVHRGGV